MTKIAVFVDATNLFYGIKTKYHRKLDYKVLRVYAEDLGHVVASVVYGTQISEGNASFIHCLQKLGFETKFKEPVSRNANWNTQITVDAMRVDTDIIMICTSDGGIAPLIEHLQQTQYVIVLACNIDRALLDTGASCVEIPESMLI